MASNGKQCNGNATETQKETASSTAVSMLLFIVINMYKLHVGEWNSINTMNEWMQCIQYNEWIQV